MGQPILQMLPVFIKEKEVQAAFEKGVYPVPFAVAMDALLPVVHSI